MHVQVEERLDDAASFMAVVDELRPLDRQAFNPFYEVWKRIARVPPAARHRYLTDACCYGCCW